jgi:hypothetical protein
MVLFGMLIHRWRSAPLNSNGSPAKFSVGDLTQTAAHQSCDRYLQDG